MWTTFDINIKAFGKSSPHWCHINLIKGPEALLKDRLKDEDVSLSRERRLLQCVTEMKTVTQQEKKTMKGGNLSLETDRAFCNFDNVVELKMSKRRQNLKSNVIFVTLERLFRGGGGEKIFLYFFPFFPYK